MIASVLNIPQGMTPLTLAVREFMSRKGIEITELAASLNMNRSTLNSRLTKQHPLDMLDPKDMELVRRIAVELGYDAAEIVERAREITAGPPRSEHDPDIVLLCLDTLQDPQGSAESKERARRSILRMLGVEV